MVQPLPSVAIYVKDYCSEKRANWAKYFLYWIRIQCLAWLIPGSQIWEIWMVVSSNNIRVYQSNDILYVTNRKKEKNMQCQDVKNTVQCFFSDKSIHCFTIPYIIRFVVLIPVGF